MRHLLAPATWFALLVILVFYIPTTAQDQTEERIADLEFRVSALETQVAGDTTDSRIGEEYTLTGVLIIGEVEEGEPGNGCFADAFEPGTPVLVEDHEGNLLATGELGEGTIDDDQKCGISFVVEGLPSVELYRLYFGRKSLAGNHDFTFEQLEDSDWTIRVDLFG
jgi:hypothetical protein